MKMYKRLKFVYWLRKISKVPEGEISPKWIIIIYAIICPLRWLYRNQKELFFDISKNTVIIGGCEYSMFLLDNFSHLASEGDQFEFIGRENIFGKKIITIKRINEPS
jgi:hypothetical protein